MKVSINIVDFGSLNDLLDSPLIWETEYIPLIGDKLEYCNFDETVDFIGKIVERIFIIGTDEVVLEVEVNNDTYDTLSNYLKEVRTKKK